MGLADVADRRIGGFSLGMTQRLGVPTALPADPSSLILDRARPSDETPDRTAGERSPPAPSYAQQSSSAVRLGPGVEGAVEQQGPFAQTDEAVAAAGEVEGGGGTVVGGVTDDGPQTAVQGLDP